MASIIAVAHASYRSDSSDNIDRKVEKARVKKEVRELQDMPLEERVKINRDARQLRQDERKFDRKLRQDERKRLESSNPQDGGNFGGTSSSSN